MLIENTKCPNCGAILNVDKSIESISCKYCGSIFSLFNNKMDKKNLSFKNIHTYMNLNQYDNARIQCKKLIDKSPDDYRLWEYLAIIDINDMLLNNAHCSLSKCISYINNAKILNTNYDANSFWNNIIQKHGNKLKIIQQEQFNKLRSTKYTCLSSFDTELICHNTIELPKQLQILQRHISEEYSKLVVNGELLLFKNGSDEFWGISGYIGDSFPYNNPVMVMLYQQGRTNAKSLNQSPYKEIIAKRLGVEYADNVCFLIGKVIAYYDWNGYLRIELLSESYYPDMINPTSAFFTNTMYMKNKRDSEIKGMELEILSLCRSVMNKERLLNDIAIYFHENIYYHKDDNPNNRIVFHIDKVENNTIYFSIHSRIKGAWATDWMISKYHLGIPDYMVLLIFLRKRCNHCQYCGGKISRINKTCSKCGKLKDY